MARVHAAPLRGLARLQRRAPLLRPAHRGHRRPLRRVSYHKKIFTKVWKNIFSRKTKPSDLKLGFGSHTLDIYRPSPLAEHEQRLEVGEIVRHPRYSAYVARWDTGHVAAV